MSEYDKEWYEKGLLDGYTKSIVLIRSLQRTLSTNESISSTTTLFEILEQAMELIAENIKDNNNDEFFSREDDAREI